MGKETDKRWKGIVLDWAEISDMDSEDYELKPLNQQQVAILLALLQYQKWQTRWLNLDLSNDELLAYIGEIEYRLMLNEGGIGMTPEELENAISNGIYKAVNDVSKQIVSGRTFGFSVGDDGTVTTPDPNDPTGELPEDDPATLIDEVEAAKMGGYIAQAKAVELFLDKIDNYYGATNNTPVVPMATTEENIALYFPVDDIALEAALTVYYSYRTSNPRILFDTTEAQQNIAYCKGGGKQAFNQWLIDHSGYSNEKISVVSGLTNALSDEFWENYYSQGIAKLSSQYLDAPCVPVEFQDLSAMIFNIQRTTINMKPTHRLLCTAEGYAQDIDGDTQDAFWYRTAAGVLTFAPLEFKHGAVGLAPSQFEVPYRSDHKYNWTSDTANLSNTSLTVQILRNANMNLTGLSYPVAFRVTIKDLGESGV